MGIPFTSDQALALAPDTSSASAGKKLANAKHWKNLGQSAQALWGECQGSALYQVRADLATMTLQCSCPSRKQPCKHCLALLLLTINTPDAVPTADAPDWIVTWLAKRAATAQRKETREAAGPASAEPSAAQLKNAEKRLALVTAGIEQLDLWLADLIRNGLGSLEAQPARFWESQAAQMVDAQAPGLATRIRALSAIPNASPDWPARLLAHLGQLALLTEAFHHLDQLEPALQEDIRQLVGWNLKEDELLVRGTHVSDDWLFLGHTLESLEHGRSQRIWLFGTSTQRSALVLQFSFAGLAFPESYPLGSHQRSELVYWPGALPQRALVHLRHGQSAPVQDRLPGFETFEAFFEVVATMLASQSWQVRFLCLMRDVIPIYEPISGAWQLRDQSGQALPLAGNDHWQLLAYSGGYPIDFAGEWNGETLLPLGVLADASYHIL